MIRADGRAFNELRPVNITPGAQEFAEGSVVVETGQTRVLCAVSVEAKVPPFLRGSGKGWITAEYAMLPRSTVTRTPRDSRIGGRAKEIQRLIGRSLRAAVDLEQLGERTLIVDCDVLQADGGTRTAAITGGYVALYQALNNMLKRNIISSIPIKSGVAAVSVGIINGRPLLDLSYEEDFRAEADFNVAMTAQGEFVEVQGSAEGNPFPRETLDEVLSLAGEGIEQLLHLEGEVIAGL